MEWEKGYKKEVSTVTFKRHSKNTHDRRVTYSRLVCDVWPPKKGSYWTRLTLGRGSDGADSQFRMLRSNLLN